MTDVIRLFRNAISSVRRFRDHDRGSIAMFAGLSAIPIIFSVGAGIDYSTANMAKTKLDSIADAAALSAVDHRNITTSSAAATATATAVFSAQAGNIKNITVTGPTVTVTDSATGRTSVVSYTA
ncbi:MAG TPA: pilus assembly protein TadG-related protein, partial [Xanthobacteraceae bacterium]|nr:pilus assembly protein TadG-related protein [Xanthobacteraceae bacterium]